MTVKRDLPRFLWIAVLVATSLTAQSQKGIWNNIDEIDWFLIHCARVTSDIETTHDRQLSLAVSQTFGITENDLVQLGHVAQEHKGKMAPAINGYRAYAMECAKRAVPLDPNRLEALEHSRRVSTRLSVQQLKSRLPSRSLDALTAYLERNYWSQY